MLLSRKVVYVEEALSWFNDRQDEMDRPTCGSVEELCERLQSYFTQLGKYGYQSTFSHFFPLARRQDRLVLTLEISRF